MSRYLAIEDWTPLNSGDWRELKQRRRVWNTIPNPYLVHLPIRHDSMAGLKEDCMHW
jgi:hypothetical protein